MEDKSHWPIVSVFGSNRPLPGSEIYNTALLLGKLLANVGISVATGGYEGTMAAVSQGAAAAGGCVIGVTSQRIEQSRGARPNRWLNKEIRYESLADRQMHLINENHGMIILPGGIGTLAEFALAWSLMQVGEIPTRPLILLGQTWRDTLACYVTERYVHASHMALLTFADSPDEIIDYLCQQIHL